MGGREGARPGWVRPGAGTCRHLDRQYMPGIKTSQSVPRVRSRFNASDGKALGRRDHRMLGRSDNTFGKG